MTHELAHSLGHARHSDGRTYNSIFASDFSGCNPTGYSDNTTGTPGNERNAEVLAAFITNPARLTEGSRACQRAYDFLSTEVFKANGSLASCGIPERQELLSRIQGIGTGDVSVASFERAFSAPRTSTSEEVDFAEAQTSEATATN